MAANLVASLVGIWWGFGGEFDGVLVRNLVGIWWGIWRGIFAFLVRICAPSVFFPRPRNLIADVPCRISKLAGLFRARGALRGRGQGRGCAGARPVSALPKGMELRPFFQFSQLCPFGIVREFAVGPRLAPLGKLQIAAPARFRLKLFIRLPRGGLGFSRTRSVRGAFSASAILCAPPLPACGVAGIAAAMRITFGRRRRLPETPCVAISLRGSFCQFRCGFFSGGAQFRMVQKASCLWLLCVALPTVPAERNAAMSAD